MNRLKQENQTIIYLDQFAVSGLFESKESYWSTLRKHLLSGIKMGLFICPISREHLIESSQRKESSAKSIDTSFSEISNGFSFKAELHISSQLLISRIRKNNITQNTYLQKNTPQNILSNSEYLNELKENSDLFDVKMNEATQLPNQIRQISREKNIRNGTISIDVFKQITIRHFIERLENLLNDGEIKVRGVHFTSGDIPHWIDQIIFRLVETHKMSPKETKRLIIELKNHGFCNIPSLDIRTSLSSLIASQNKKETANDQVDIMRLSTGLPYSNILFTDKKRKYEVEFLGLDKKYDTLIYSGIESDILSLTEILNNKITTYNNGYK